MRAWNVAAAHWCKPDSRVWLGSVCLRVFGLPCVAHLITNALGSRNPFFVSYVKLLCAASAKGEFLHLQQEAGVGCCSSRRTLAVRASLARLHDRPSAGWSKKCPGNNGRKEKLPKNFVLHLQYEPAPQPPAARNNGKKRRQTAQRHSGITTKTIKNDGDHPRK